MSKPATPSDYLVALIVLLFGIPLAIIVAFGLFLHFRDNL